jgi:hypothetical protein
MMTGTFNKKKCKSLAYLRHTICVPSDINYDYVPRSNYI